MRASLAFILQHVEEKKWLMLGYLALLLESLTPVIAVVLQRDLIDQVFMRGQYQAFPRMIVLYGVFFFGPKLCFTVRKVTFFHVSYQAQARLTETFLRKIYHLPLAFVRNETTGKLLNHVRNDIADACNLGINQLLSESVRIGVSLILLCVSLAYISPIMLVVVFLIALVYYVLLRRFGETTKQLAKRTRQEKGRVSQSIEESISSVRETVAFNRQEWQLNRFRASFHKYYQAVRKASWFKIRVLFVSEPFLYGSKLTVILIGGWAAMEGRMSLGALVAGYTLADQMVTAMGQLFDQGLTGKKLVAAVECLQAILKQPDQTKGVRELEGEVHTLQLEQVSFSYSDDHKPVLKDLTLDLPMGKKIALVGGSGSGKSTIAQLLIRNYEASQGQVSLNTHPVTSYNKTYTEGVGIVFQNPHFIPMSIKENLCFGKNYGWSVVEEACRAMACHGFIEDLPNQYDTLLGEKGVNLSGGQKQRLALARALIKDPEVLILDEATSALDTETETLVQTNLDRIRKGKTTIVIAHRLSTISNADLIYVLDKGKVVAQGSHAQLMESSKTYQQLYKNQQVS